MTGKKTLRLFLIPLLIVSMALVSTPPAHADLPVLSLNYPETIPALGTKFTVDLNITGVTDMKGFTFKLGYNTTVLNATIVSATGTISEDTTDWLPVDESMVFHWDAPPTIDRTIGQVWVASWGFTTFTGSGTLLKINFTATALGNSTLHLYDTEVLNIYADPIEHQPVDGELEVVPEFPTFIIMPLLLITSLAAALLGKTFWSKKRKDALIAE